MDALRTRPPTGRVPWPLILVEGGEKSGKSWMAAEFSASTRIGQMYWLDLGEGAGDEYGAIPGARYLLVEHDGTWPSILSAVEAVRAEAQRAADAGEPPVVLTVDSMTAEWEMLSTWAYNRARDSESNRRLLRDNPNAEINVTANYWNDANARHRKLMTLLMTFPGVVVVTARGKEVAAIGANGQPLANTKAYKVEGQKALAFDASVWVRLALNANPQIVGARSVHLGIKPTEDRARVVPGLTLERLVFDMLHCSPREAQVRPLAELQPGHDAPSSPTAVAMMAAVEDAPDEETLRRLYAAIGPALEAGDVTRPEADRIADMVKARKPQVPAGETPAQVNGREPMATARQHGDLRMLWKALKLDGEAHRDHRLARMAAILALPDLDSAAKLTFAQARQVIAALEADKAELEGVGVRS